MQITFDSPALGVARLDDPSSRRPHLGKSSTCASGSDKVAFTYNGEGHRTKIVATAAGGTVTTTDFRYQGDAVVEEKVNNVIARSFVVDEAGAIVKMIVPSASGPDVEYLVSWNGHGDALHLLRVKADGTTELANSFTYSTWGTPTLNATHPNSADGGQPYGDLGFRYLYVGEFDVQWDNTFGLGLHYMHARHYAPALGRFLQPDPDGLEDSLYAYAANNPVTEIDPDGTCFIVCLVVGAVVDTALYLASTDSSEWDFGTAITTVASGAVESMVNPFGKVTRVVRLAETAARAAGKVSRASRAAASVGSRAGRAAASAPRRHTPDQQALVALAKEARRRGPVSRAEAEALEQWRREYALPGHGPMRHPRRPRMGVHVNIGPVRHILVRTTARFQ